MTLLTDKTLGAIQFCFESDNLRIAEGSTCDPDPEAYFAFTGKLLKHIAAQQSQLDEKFKYADPDGGQDCCPYCGER